MLKRSISVHQGGKRLNKKILIKKEKGSINGLMYVIVSVMAVFLFVVGILPCINVLNTKVKINNSCRAVLLKMETQGYLDSATEQTLREQLSSYDVQIISDVGTTKTKAEYGSVITLHLTLEYTYGYLDLSNILSPKSGKTERIQLIYDKTSIAKY